MYLLITVGGRWSQEGRQESWHQLLAHLLAALLHPKTRGQQQEPESLSSPLGPYPNRFTILAGTPTPAQQPQAKTWHLLSPESAPNTPSAIQGRARNTRLTSNHSSNQWGPTAGQPWRPSPNSHSPHQTPSGHSCPHDLLSIQTTILLNKVSAHVLLLQKPRRLPLPKQGICDAHHGPTDCYPSSPTSFFKSASPGPLEVWLHLPGMHPPWPEPSQWAPSKPSGP